jgi:hypothetical protein
MRSVYRIVVGMSKGKRPFGRPRFRLGEKIEMELGEIQCENVIPIYWYEDRVH